MRSSFLCAANTEASSGLMQQVDGKETNGCQRLSLANIRAPEGRLQSVYGYVSVGLFCLSDRTTPSLLCVPIGACVDVTVSYVVAGCVEVCEERICIGG